VQRLRSTCVRLWHSGWCQWHACLHLQTDTRLWTMSQEHLPIARQLS